MEIEQAAIEVAAPLLGEEAQEIATAHLRYLGCTCPVDPYDPEDCASVAAEVIRVLQPFVAALVAEQERRADRMRDEAQHWAAKMAEAVDERESAEARAYRAEAALETLTDRARSVIDGWDDITAAWRDGPLPLAIAGLRAALSAPADASGEAPFTAAEIDRCHESTDFAHVCKVCRAPDEKP